MFYRVAAAKWSDKTKTDQSLLPWGFEKEHEISNHTDLRVRLGFAICTSKRKAYFSPCKEPVENAVLLVPLGLPFLENILVRGSATCGGRLSSPRHWPGAELCWVMAHRTDRRPSPWEPEKSRVQQASCASYLMILKLGCALESPGEFQKILIPDLIPDQGNSGREPQALIVFVSCSGRSEGLQSLRASIQI